MQETTSLTAAQIDRALSASQLDADAVRKSQEAYHRYAALQAGQPAGWHGPTDIVTLTGLGGDFVWWEDWILPAKMSFTFDPGYEGHKGSYVLSRMPSAVEEGAFYCVPNNPAVGWAFVSLVPNGGTARAFTVAGMLTDNAWQISVLLLNKVGAHGPINPPFSALRTL
jgi:hypothetical protein